MKSKLLSILILGSLFIAGSQIVAGENLAVKKTDIVYDLSIDDPYRHDEVIRDKATLVKTTTGNFDMFLECLAWWVPVENGQQGGVIGHNLLVDFVGTYDNTRDYQLTIMIWANYQEDQILLKSSSNQFGTFFLPKLGWLGSKSIENKPDSLTFEFETNYPEEPTDNNQKTTNLEPGIIVEGSVKTVTMSGETIPVYGVINCLADESHFMERYFSTRALPEYNSEYFVTMPYKPRFEYPIVSSYAGVPIIKNLGPTEEYQSYLLDFLFTGLAPDAPEINGPTNGNVGKKSTYTLSSTDLEGDDLFYYIYWGECGEEMDWQGPFSSGVDVEFSHKWKKQGNYQIRARAKDVNGYISGWSYLEISMPKTRLINNPLTRLLDNHPRMFPILRLLLKL